MKNLSIIGLITSLFLYHLTCQEIETYKGQFLWAQMGKDENKIIPDKFLQPKQYYNLRKPLSFNAYEYIFWIYQFTDGAPIRRTDPLSASPTLFFNNVFNLKTRSLPIQEYQKKLKLDFASAEYPILRDRLQVLAPGRYQLQIGYKNQMIDSTEFSIRVPVREPPPNNDSF